MLAFRHWQPFKLFICHYFCALQITAIYSISWFKKPVWSKVKSSKNIKITYLSKNRTILSSSRIDFLVIFRHIIQNQFIFGHCRVIYILATSIPWVDIEVKHNLDLWQNSLFQKKRKVSQSHSKVGAKAKKIMKKEYGFRSRSLED